MTCWDYVYIVHLPSIKLYLNMGVFGQAVSDEGTAWSWGPWMDSLSLANLEI